MEKTVSLLLVGIGGYGNTYVDGLLDNKRNEDFKIVGAVDPVPEACRRLAEIKERNIPIYSSMEEFYSQNGIDIDLVVISSPIQYHLPQSRLALEKGSNVLCEKPASATIQEVKKMIEARDKSGKFLEIGFQWSYAQAIQNLKKDIQEGAFGKPERFKTFILWPRDEDYYSRGWAAKKKDSNGNWILDSIANNATAHYIHNMFYVLGDKVDASANPASVVAELYRANDIENFDTAAARIFTDDGIELMYYASHAIRETVEPAFCYEFENAKVVFGDFEEEADNKNIVAIFNDGHKKNYGNPNLDRNRKLWLAMEAIREDKKILCGPEAASSHVKCINGMQESMVDIQEFSDELVKYDKENGITWVQGLNEDLKECYSNWKLPSEENKSWAKAGEEIDLKDYKYFNGDNI